AKAAATFLIAAAAATGIALGVRTANRKVEPIRPSPTPSIGLPTGPALKTNGARVGSLAGISTDAAWAVTDDSDGGAHLWRTGDRAAHWLEVTGNLPSWAPGLDPSHAVFPDRDNAYVHSAAGDFWFITSNGGKTWSFITLPRHQGPNPTDTYTFENPSDSAW